MHLVPLFTFGLLKWLQVSCRSHIMQSNVDISFPLRLFGETAKWLFTDGFCTFEPFIPIYSNVNGEGNCAVFMI